MLGVLRMGLFLVPLGAPFLLWQPSRALEGVAQDPLYLAVGAAHLIVRPALDGLPYGGVYAKGVLLACHEVLSYRAEVRVAGKPQFRDCP